MKRLTHTTMKNERLVNFSVNLSSIVEKLKNRVIEILEENDVNISNMNIEQLKEGLRSDGVYLPDYSDVSVEQYGKEPGAIKLYDTGEFYSKFFSTVEKQNEKIKLNIRNNSKKKIKPINLQGRYGVDIVGLTEENIKNVEEKIIIPEIIKYIKINL